jgi:hypothetical protein
MIVKSVIAGEYTPPGGRAHDQADLRDHPRRAGVAEEDLREQPQRRHALLDPRPAPVVDPDHRAARLHRVVHDLDDLLAVDLAQAAAEHGEVVAVDRDRAAVHGADPGDHAVAVGAVAPNAEVMRPVPGQLVEFNEGALVKQQLDPFPGGQLALACCFSIGASEPACTASYRLRSRSAILPAVVCGSGTLPDPVRAVSLTEPF